MISKMAPKLIPKLHVDDILLMLGRFGRFQLGVILLLSVVNTFWAFHVLSMVFIIGNPPHQCLLPANVSVREVVNVTEDSEKSQCEFQYDATGDNATVQCERWEYAQDYPYTAVQEVSITV